MFIEIKDDFDLEKIAESGQCFRVRKTKGDTWRFVTGEHVLYILKVSNQKFDVSCSEREWERIWSPYFDLGRSYAQVFAENYGKHPFVDEAMRAGRGLRILRQDAWETLVTFLISQRKNIPSITRCVELLSSRYGHPIGIGMEKVSSFPTPAEFSEVTEKELAQCGLGYRTGYVLDAVYQVLNGFLSLDSLAECTDEQLLERLQGIRGVGKKVASCVALFAYGRTACVPVDVWISRAIEEDCEGTSPFALYGDHAGLIQQYVYYYEKHRGSVDH